MYCHILPIFSLFDPFALSKSTHESSRVCKMKTGVGEERRKKQSWNVPEDTLTILVLLWPFDLFQSKYGAKQLVYHDQHPIWPPEGAQCQTNSTLPRTAAPSVDIFTPREKYIYHAAFKHENIGHNKMKRKVYNIDFLFTVTLRNNEQDEALCFLIYYLYIPINLVL